MINIHLFYQLLPNIPFSGAVYSGVNLSIPWVPVRDFVREVIDG